MFKRAFSITLFICLILIFLAVVLFIVFYRPSLASNPAYQFVSNVRAARVDYLDEGKSRGEVDDLEARLKKAGVNMVAIGAGRVEWTYFPWPGHPDSWSTDVRNSGHDYLLEDSTRFGKWAHVSAVVDVLSPLYIQAHPETAALSWTGEPSRDLVSTMELVQGPYGQNLLDMIDKIARDYPVNSICLTELTYYTDGYSDQDKAAYTAYTGKSDWPRRPDGTINIDDAGIGDWRMYELGRFLDKAAGLAHAQGKLLFLEMHVEVNSSGQVIVENGTDIAQLLKHVDRLIVRDSNSLYSSNPNALEAIGRYLTAYDQSRLILGIGLWDRDYPIDTPRDQMHAINAAEFQYALQAADRGKAKNLWVTPSFLMADEHWEILDTLWGNRAGK